MVKNIPIPQPITPRIENKPATISNPNKIIGFLETTIALDLIDSIAFSFPKTIKGMVKNVKKDIIIDNKLPTKL